MPSCLGIYKKWTFPTLVISDIHFLTVPMGIVRTSLSDGMDLFTEHFPTPKGKGDVCYNNRREKLVFQFHGTVFESRPGVTWHTEG